MKHIASLLNSFMPNNNTPFGNKLLASSLMQNNHQILMTDILYLIECFEGFGPECNGIYLSGQEYLQQFFKIVSNKPLTGFISIKITLTLHLILYEFQIGEVVADEMAKHENTVRIAPNSQHCQFISNYLMYLMKLGQSLKVFYSCKIGQYPILDSDYTQGLGQQTESTREPQIQMLRKQTTKDGNRYRSYQQKQPISPSNTNINQNNGYITIESKMLYLFKLHNLLNNCIQILNLCIGVLNTIDKPEHKNIYIEVGCVLWNDAMVMYKFTTQELCKLLDSFKSLQLAHLQSLQQVYQATITVTKSLRWVYINRKSFDIQNIVKQPYWFEENLQMSRQIQNSIIDSKIGQCPESSRGLKIQTPKAQLSHKSPAHINQPFSSRISTSKTNQPFFSAQHKKVASTTQIQQSIPAPPDSRRNQYVQQVIGNLFSDDLQQLSPRDKKL